jgi:hypothetical protein
MGEIMSDQKDVKPNDGSTSENYIRFRISTDDKEKIRDYFGSFSDMREYVLDVVEGKGDDVKREGKK